MNEPPPPAPVPVPVAFEVRFFSPLGPAQTAAAVYRTREEADASPFLRDGIKGYRVVPLIPAPAFASLVALLRESSAFLYSMGFDRKAPEDILSRIDTALRGLRGEAGG